jgi:hypothetical protein
MNTNPNSQSKWPVGVFFGSSAPIVLMMIGIIIEVVTWVTASLRPRTGIEDTTIENALLFGGLYLALPCGILNVVMAIFLQSKHKVSKKGSTTAIIVGILGILMGILAWVMFIMVSSFEF